MNTSVLCIFYIVGYYCVPLFCLKLSHVHFFPRQYYPSKTSFLVMVFNVISFQMLVMSLFPVTTKNINSTNNFIKPFLSYFFSGMYSPKRDDWYTGIDNYIFLFSCSLERLCQYSFGVSQNTLQHWVLNYCFVFSELRHLEPGRISALLAYEPYLACLPQLLHL